MPTTRPRMRCSHSQKKIALNPASVMPRLISLYSGICLYFSNSATQSASLSGGSTPETGRHSVIDSPDSVSRVIPPTPTTTTTSNATAHSQRASAAGRGWRAAGEDKVEACVIAPPYRRLVGDRQAPEKRDHQEIHGRDRRALISGADAASRLRPCCRSVAACRCPSRRDGARRSVPLCGPGRAGSARRGDRFSPDHRQCRLVPGAAAAVRLDLGRSAAFTMRIGGRKRSPSMAPWTAMPSLCRGACSRVARGRGGDARWRRDHRDAKAAPCPDGADAHPFARINGDRNAARRAPAHRAARARHGRCGAR